MISAVFNGIFSNLFRKMTVNEHDNDLENKNKTRKMWQAVYRRQARIYTIKRFVQFGNKAEVVWNMYAQSDWATPPSCNFYDSSSWVKLNGSSSFVPFKQLSQFRPYLVEYYGGCVYRNICGNTGFMSLWHKGSIIWKKEVAVHLQSDFYCKTNS